MKRMIVLTVACLVIVLLCLSCQAETPVAVMDRFHTRVNAGEVDYAMAFVANDAVFKVKAAPIAGVNGEFSGQEAISAWLTEISGQDAQVDVFGMDLEANKLTCLLSYRDRILEKLGLDGLVMEEASVVTDGLIRSYTLTLVPSAQAQFQNAVAVGYSALRTFDPADRKFYMSGHISRPGDSAPWFRDIEPADRKFYFDSGCTLPSMSPEDVCDRKFYDKGYITNQDG